MITQLIKNGEVVDTSAESNSSSSTSKKSGGSLDKDAFLQLLVAQMKYQDPLEPTDNTEYISQLATFSQLEETQNMQASLQEMEANSLVGKQVVLRVTSSATGETSDVTGTVDSELICYLIHAFISLITFRGLLCFPCFFCIFFVFCTTVTFCLITVFSCGSL